MSINESGILARHLANIQTIENLGRYQNLVPVGAGSFATVYKAIDSLLQRSVALKVLAPNIAIDQEFVKEFIGEAQKAATIDHQNVVRVYDVGEDGGQHYIALEYLESSLGELLTQTGRLSLQLASKLFIDIASGLHAAHSQDPSLVHYDVKPQNILLDATGTAKVGDFGIAELASATRGTARGTPKYIAPEVATLSKSGSDQRADIYSLGVVFFEMLTGVLPFDGATEYEVTKQHVENPAPDPRDLVPELPDWVAEIVLKCLEKDPNRRYPTMLLAIEAVAANVPDLASTAAATATIEFVPYQRPPQYRLWQFIDLVKANRVAASAIAAALVATLILVVTVSQPSPSSPALIAGSGAPVQVPVRVVQVDDVFAPVVSEELSSNPVVAQAVVEGETQVNELRVLKSLSEQELANMSFEVSLADTSVVAALPRMLNVLVDSFLQIDLQEVSEPHNAESTVSFEVDRDWIDQFELPDDEIRLFRFADDGWWELNTIIVGSTASTIEYEALTPGFSIFAVGSTVTDEKAVSLGDELSWPTIESGDAPDEPRRVVSALPVPEVTVEPVVASPEPLPTSNSTPATATAVVPSPTPQSLASQTPSPTTIAPVASPIPTALPTVVPTPAKPTPTTVSVPSPTPVPVPTLIISPTATSMPASTPVPTQLPIATSTPELTQSPTPAGDPTSTPVATPTAEPTPTPDLVQIDIAVVSDASTYAHSDVAQITFTATENSVPIPYVQVILVVNEPNSGIQQKNLITDSSGMDNYSFRLNKNKGGCGTYTVTATTDFGGSQSIAVSTFVLLCN